MDNKDPKARTSKSKGKSHEIFLSAPWEKILNIHNCVRSDSESFKELEPFLMNRTKLHESYILEEAKTKRLSIIISAILFLSGCGAILFSPEGKENISQWIGGAMILLSAGAAGYKSVWGKSAVLSVGAGEHHDPQA